MQGTAHAMVSTSQERAMAKLHAQAAQWEEYEDEYDDSFDDLAGYDADANADTQSEPPFALHPNLSMLSPQGTKQAKRQRAEWLICITLMC